MPNRNPASPRQPATAVTVIASEVSMTAGKANEGRRVGGPMVELVRLRCRAENFRHLGEKRTAQL